MKFKYSINVLSSRSFHLTTVVGVLNISLKASIKMTKTEKIIILTQYLDPLKLKMFLKAYFESPFRGDLTNSITIEFSIRNDGKIRC